MQLSTSQARRIKELCHRLHLEPGHIAASFGLDALDDLTEAQASRAIGALLEVNELPLPENTAQASARLSAAFGTVERPVRELRAPDEGEEWTGYVAAVLNLVAAVEPCEHCGGAGTRPVPQSKGALAALLTGQATSSTHALHRKATNPSFAFLRSVAGEWFDGDLNAAAEFLTHVSELTA